MSIDPALTAVVAALGSSALIGLIALGLGGRQHRQRERAAARQDRFATYGKLLARSVTIVTRVRATGDTMRLRSGLAEGLDIALRHRRPIELMELHDWFSQDFRQLTDAWVKIWTVGTQNAIDAADRLVDACGDLIEAATSQCPKRGWLWSALRGKVWTEEQRATYQETLERVSAERVAFARLTRMEMGNAAVDFALDRAATEAASIGSVSPGGRST